MGKGKAEKDLFEIALGIVDEITAMCGTEAIEDTALDFEIEDYDQYRKQRDELVNAIVNIVKFQENPFDFQAFETKINDEEFWEEVEGDVKRKTRSFMKVISYRKLEEEKRLELIDKGFDIVYYQRENLQFMIREIDNEVLAKALYEVILGSEYVIVNRYASKRQFKDIVINNIRLEDADLEYIWDKYAENTAIVEKIATVRSNIRMENQISYLINRMNALEDILQTVFEKDE